MSCRNSSLDDAGYQIESIPCGRRRLLQQVAIDMFGDFIRTQAGDRIEWMSERFDHCRCDTADRIDHADDLLEVLLHAWKLIWIERKARQAAKLFDILSSDRHG